jgi:hypothetical protein
MNRPFYAMPNLNINKNEKEENIESIKWFIPLAPKG